MVYIIGENIFKFKKNAIDYTRKRLGESSKGVHGPDSDLFTFLSALIDLHPEKEEKIGVGIKHFILSLNIGGGSHLDLVRLDDSKIDVSWKTCAGFHKKKVTTTTPIYLHQAMRDSIHTFTGNFKHTSYREHGKFKCALCPSESVEYDGINFHTDHILPFSIICDEFLKNQVKTPITFATRGYMTSFREEDKIFENKWVEYHNEKATYRILCKSCNSKSWR